MAFCPNCGRQVTDDATFCRNCGFNLKTTSAQSQSLATPVPPTTASVQLSPSAGKRPSGVSILSVLNIVGGIFLTILGFSYAGTGTPTLGSYTVELGLITVITGWGMWKGRGWSWNLYLILAVAGIVISPISEFSLGLVGIIATVIVIVIELLFSYYITRPHVMTYFGKKSIRQEFL